MEKSVMVIGGGVAGIQASLDLADKGILVHLVEKTPSIGGSKSQLDKTFPTNDCSICILAPKMADCFSHPNTNVITYAEVASVEGKVGNFKVKVLKKARYVDEAMCTGCGECLEKCPSKVPSEFEMGLATRKAIYMPFMQAVPRVMTIDKEHCTMLTKGKCGNCKKACKREAIDYEMKDQILEIEVGSIIVATGYDVWDPSSSTEYGYGKYPNVYTAMEYERMINAAGPTHGHIERRSDKKRPQKMAFIQCVGSRNPQIGPPYCCSVCCMHSTKEAMLAREHHDDMESTVFYKDMRACAKGFYEYVERARRDYGVRDINSDATCQECSLQVPPKVLRTFQNRLPKARARLRKRSRRWSRRERDDTWLRRTKQRTSRGSACSYATVARTSADSSMCHPWQSTPRHSRMSSTRRTICTPALMTASPRSEKASGSTT